MEQSAQVGVGVGGGVERKRGGTAQKRRERKDVIGTVATLLFNLRWFILVASLLYMSMGALFTFLLLPCYIALFTFGFLSPFINSDDPKLELIKTNVISSFYDYSKYHNLSTVGQHKRSSSADFPSDKTSKSKNSKLKIDTGHDSLDAELNEVLDLVLRDYVHSWYDRLLPQFLSGFNCENEELFPSAIRTVSNQLCNDMVSRLKVANQMNPLVNFFTSEIVEIIKVHVGLYRQADQKVPRAFRTQIDKQAQEIRNNEVRAMFFDLEAQRSSDQTGSVRCRDFLAQDDKAFSDYLRCVTEAILLAVMPLEEYKSRPVRHGAREILVTQVMKPTFDAMCSPDFVNSCLIRYTPGDSGSVSQGGSAGGGAGACVSSEAFCEMVRCCSNVEELDAIIAFAFDERATLQKQDNSGDSVNTKKQLNSISYLISECNSRIEKLLKPQMTPQPQQGVSSATNKMSSVLSSLSQFGGGPAHSNFSFDEDYEVAPSPAMSGAESVLVAGGRKTASAKRQKSLDFTPAISLSLGQILHSFHDEFHSYLEKCNASRFLQFYDNAQAYRTTVDEVNSYRDERMMVSSASRGSSDQSSTTTQMSSSQDVQVHLDTMRDFAEYLLEAYQKLAEEKHNSVAYNFKLDMAAVKELKQKIVNKSLEPGYDWFDKIAQQSFDFMKSHPMLYPSFVASRSYRQLFQIGSSSEDATTESSTNQRVSESSEADPTSPMKRESGVFEQLSKDTPTCGIWAELIAYQISDEGKRHAVYEVAVQTFLLNNGTKPADGPKCYRIYRRYSDFLQLYEKLRKKYSALESIKFPPKKASQNLSEQLLIKRKDQLGVFLQEILSPEVISANPGMLQIVHGFLSPNYVAEKTTKSESSVGSSKQKLHRANTVLGGSPGANIASQIAAPTASYHRNTTDDLTSLDPNVEIGAGNRGVIARSVSAPRGALGSSSSLASLSLANNDQDSLAPETIKSLIDLFFEIFDVRGGSGGDWNVVRAQLAHAISRVLRATFGDRINRKIVKLVSSFMTEEAVCGYICSLREYFWPQGFPSTPGEPKSIQDKYRTKFLAKVKLYGSISGEIKSLPFVTQDVIKRGILRLIKLCQDEQLNRRLGVVIFEQLLIVIFPDLKMKEILDRVYLQSARVKALYAKT